jgi:hypothetical protein
MMLEGLNFSFAYGPYAIVAYLASACTAAYALNRKAHFDRLFENLKSLPEEDRIHALELAYGPIPKNVTANQWIRDRRNTRIFLSILAVVIALTPVALLSLSAGSVQAQEVIAHRIFNIPGEEARPGIGTTDSSNNQHPSEEQVGTAGATSDGEDGPQAQPNSETPSEISTAENPESGGAVSVAPARTQDRRRNILAPTIPERGALDYHLGASISGILESVAQSEAYVRKNSVVARIACRELQAEERAATANRTRLKATRQAIEQQSGLEELNISQYEIESATATLQEKERRQKVWEDLHGNLAVSAAAVEAAKNETDIARANLKIAQERKKLLAASIDERKRKAKEQVEYAGDQIEILRARLERCEIRSPVDGVVIYAKSPGDRVTAGNTNPIVVVRKQARENA